MIDIQLIRESPEIVRENIRKKFQNEKLPLVDEAKKLDGEWRKLKYREDGFRSERNKISEKINGLMKAKKKSQAEELIKKAKSIPEEISRIEERRKKLEQQLKIIVEKIPNIISKKVPLGKNDKENV